MHTESFCLDTFLYSGTVAFKEIYVQHQNNQYVYTANCKKKKKKNQKIDTHTGSHVSNSNSISSRQIMNFCLLSQQHLILI